MSNLENMGSWSGDAYAQALAGESEYWDNFIAHRLLRGEMPGSVDWRLNFTQFRYNHDWRPLCLGPQGVNFRMREINYVLRAAVPRPGVRVLDLGCGAGWLSLELARLGAHVTALDISPTNLALARYMADTNTRNFPFLYQGFAGMPCKPEDFGSVEYVYADLNTVDLPAGEYDAVVVWDSLHHVANLERLLEGVRIALRPGGSFIGVDHAFTTPLTFDYNAWAWPIIEGFYSWVTENDTRWLYDDVNAAARRRDWGVLAADYDPTPVPGFERFQGELFGEMLDLIRNSLRQEALEKARAGPAQPSAAEKESPFEDVSARRLMRVLYESFGVKEFRTICPFIQPEERIPHYRTEEERIFQHYLAIVLINEGERAIRRGQADGQWFVFHVTPPPASLMPSQVALPRWLHEFGADVPSQLVPRLQEDMARKNEYIARLQEAVAHKDLDVVYLQEAVARKNDDVAHLQEDTARKNGYIAHLERELADKNAAMSDLETRLQQREAELDDARRPRLPWKRNK